MSKPNSTTETDQAWSLLTDLFRDVLDDDELVLTEDTTADTVEGWDSVKHVELMVAVEQEFDIHLQTSELAELKNVGDLMRVIQTRRA